MINQLQKQIILILVLKTTDNTDKAELEKKIPDVSNLVKKTKLSELENKIPDISNLAIKTALTTVEKLALAVQLKNTKQTITLKLQKLKIHLIIIIMTNILILQSLINQLVCF